MISVGSYSKVQYGKIHITYMLYCNSTKQYPSLKNSEKLDKFPHLGHVFNNS